MKYLALVYYNEQIMQQMTSTATTLRVRDGKAMVTDGPLLKPKSNWSAFTC